MDDLGEGAPAMMYRREAPKPIPEPGFIPPLIGCGCMCRGRSFNSGRSAPRCSEKSYRWTGKPGKMAYSSTIP